MSFPDQMMPMSFYHALSTEWEHTSELYEQRFEQLAPPGQRWLLQRPKEKMFA